MNRIKLNWPLASLWTKYEFEHLSNSVRTRFYSTARLPRVSGRKLDQSGYLLLIVPVTTFALGTWQVQRRSWKLNLISELAEKTTAEPVNLPPDLSSMDDLEYRRIRLRGKFDYGKQLYLSPRSLVEPGRENAGGGLISAGNRSTVGLWIDKDSNKGQVDGEVELVGVLRKTEKRPPFGAKIDSSKDEWNYRDTELMAAKLGTLPVFVDADASSTVPGGPKGGQTRVSLRNEHMSYIVTWYGLTVFTLYVWYMKYMKRLRK
ncbi:Surfeit locus protein 1 [Halotydeus destructor]|nr:Surfeit locus protein 1 [Halotydeus destructor]